MSHSHQDEQLPSEVVEAIHAGDREAMARGIAKSPECLEVRDAEGRTPLMLAVELLQLESARCLLEIGADPNAESEDGSTCLLIAVESEDAKSLDLVKELLEWGADVNRPGIEGWTPLHVAAVHGEVAKAEMLLEAGADVNCRKQTDGGETPLMEAAFHGLPAMVQFLLNWGADPSLRETATGRNAISIAEYGAAGPDPAVLEQLKDAPPVDPRELFDVGEVPDDFFAWLEEMGVETDLAESYRKQAEAIAANGQHEEVLRILKEAIDNG